MRYTPLTFEGFTGGLNTSLDPTALEPDELVEAMNVRVGNNGEIQRRSGYEYWSAGISGAVNHMHHWTTPDGVPTAVAVAKNGDTFFALDESFRFNTMANIGYEPPGMAGYPVSFAASVDKLYISTLRQQRMRRWDGRSLHTVNDIYKATDPEDETVYIRMPVGQHVVYRHGRMHVGHTKNDISRVWFSNVLEPEAFAEKAWVDADPEDGTGITAMLSYADELFIFKDNSMWEMTGRDPTTYSLRTVDKLRGTVSPKTVCQMRGLLVFFDRDTGIWGYDGSELTLLSEKVNQYLLKGQDYDQASTAAAYFGDDRLYVSIPWRSGGRRTFVMNAQNGAWSEYDSGFVYGEYHLNNRYQSYDHHSGLARGDEQLQRILGDEYESSFRTPWIFPMGPGVKARLRRMEIVVQGRQGSGVRVELFREMQQDHWHVERRFQIMNDLIDIPGEIAPMDLPELKILNSDDYPFHTVALDGWGLRLHSLQIRFILEYRPMQINEFTVFVTGGEDVRGERG